MHYPIVLCICNTCMLWYKYLWVSDEVSCRQKREELSHTSLIFFFFLLWVREGVWGGPAENGTPPYFRPYHFVVGFRCPFHRPCLSCWTEMFVLLILGNVRRVNGFILFHLTCLWYGMLVVLYKLDLKLYTVRISFPACPVNLPV